MAILLLDGFDTYVNSSDRYTANGGTNTSVAARNGPYGLSLGSSQNITTNFNSSTTLITGFAWKQPSSFVSFSPLRFLDTGTQQISLNLNAGSQLYFAPNSGSSTVLGGVTTSAITTTSWNYIEVLVTFNNTSGIAQLRINGVTQISLTGIDTRNGTTNNSANQIEITSSLLQTNYYDDFYICDNTGSAPQNTFLGDLYVQGLTPSSNGTLNNFSQAGAAWQASTAVSLGYSIVDSNGNIQRVTTAGTTKSGTHPTWSGSVNGTTTDNTVIWTCIQLSPLSNYNFVNELPPSSSGPLPNVLTDSNVNDQDRYVVGTPTGGTVVFGVGVNTRAAKDDTGIRAYRSVVYNGGSIVDNGSDHALTQSFTTTQDIYSTDPATNTQWTAAGVGVSEFGVKLTV